MTDHSKFVTTCDEDEYGNLILPFPEELLETLGWNKGTTLDFDILGKRLILTEVTRTDDEV